MSSNTKNNKAFRNSTFSIDNIKGSNTLIKLFCSLAIVVLICILIGNYAFKSGHLTCDHYVFNTYLYIVLAIVLMFIVVLVNDKTGIFNSLFILMFSGSMIQVIISFIILIIIMIALTYALYHVNPTNILASNAIWLSLIFIIGLILIPTIMLGRLTDVVGLAGIATLVITIVVGLLGYYLGDKIVTFNWDFYLSIALFILIIAIIVGPFFITTPETMMSFIYVISIISLIIFVLLLLSNHKKLKENSDKCIDGKVVPNYPVESYGIVIKIVNIFSNLIRILAIRKLRK
jgi:hypothetical protein